MKPITVFILIAGSAAAQEPRDPARDHFEVGLNAYDRGDYEIAIRAFRAAYDETAKPALLYNIARAHDRAGHRSEALTFYRAYLAADPNAADALEVRAYVAAIEGRVDPGHDAKPALVSAPLPQAKRPRSVPRAAIAVGGGALALLVVGAGLVGGAADEYNRLSGSCAPSCDPTSWAGLPPMRDAGAALLALGGALVVVDVALWVRWGRR